MPHKLNYLTGNASKNGVLIWFFYMAQQGERYKNRYKDREKSVKGSGKLYDVQDFYFK